MSTDTPKTPKVKQRTIPPWMKMPCEQCGNEYQASRTQPVTASRFFCGDCEVWEKATAEAESRSAARIAELEAENARLLAAQVPRPVPEGDRRSGLVVTQRASEFADAPLEFFARTEIRETREEAEADAAAVTAPFAARIEALEAERDAAILQRSWSDAMLRKGNDATMMDAHAAAWEAYGQATADRVFPPAAKRPYGGSDATDTTVAERLRELEAENARLKTDLDNAKSDMRSAQMGQMFAPRRAAQSTPRPTVDSGAPIGLDTSKPAPGFCVDEFEMRDSSTEHEGAGDVEEYAWQAFLCLAKVTDDLGKKEMCSAHGDMDCGEETESAEVFHATREEAIAASHRYYTELCAPAVAAATATLVAERDALRVRLAEVELLRDHAMQDAAAQRVLGYGLGGAITRDQLANAATYLYGPSEAARLFPAGPRAEREQADGG